MPGNNHPRRSKLARFFQPSPRHVIDMQLRLGWDDQRCADACCVSAETWRSWKAGEKHMPAGAWRLMQYEAGVLRPPDAVHIAIGDY